MPVHPMITFKGAVKMLNEVAKQLTILVERGEPITFTRGFRYPDEFEDFLSIVDTNGLKTGMNQLNDSRQIRSNAANSVRAIGENLIALADVMDSYGIFIDTDVIRIRDEIEKRRKFR